MFPVQNRLPAYEIPLLFRSGKSSVIEGLQLRYTIRSEQTKRFAVVVPLSVSKKAVVRNRMKRLVRESIRHMLPEMPMGIDGVVLVRKNLGWKDVIEMGASIKGLVLSIKGV